MFSAAALLHVSSPGEPATPLLLRRCCMRRYGSELYRYCNKRRQRSCISMGKKNGVIAGVNSNIYTDAALNNADDITCTLISSEGCLTSNNVVSNLITMTVNPAVLPAISITPSVTVYVRNACYFYKHRFQWRRCSCLHMV